MHYSLAPVVLASLAIAAVIRDTSSTQATGTAGKLPALGWNSWSAYRSHINASIIEKTAEHFISLGIKDASYKYVNMDDYWSDYGGRDKDGKLRADSSRFPGGIPPLPRKSIPLGLKPGWADVRSWGSSIAQAWRVSSDIQDPWNNIMGTMNQALFMANTVDFYSHNDMDILQVGNGKLSTLECRSHFTMWAATKSPILIGTDLGSLSKTNLEILKNKYLLAFHQDTVHGKPAVPFNWNWLWDRTEPTAHYWSGSSSAGTLVLMFNPGSKTEEMTAKWSDVPELKGGGPYEVKDIWTGKTSCVKTGFTRSVVSHDGAGAIIGKKC